MAKHTKRHKMPTNYIEGIPIREVKPGYFLVDFMRDGIRTRKGYPTFEEAKTYAKAKAVEIRNKGTSALTISDRLRVEVEEVVRKLNGRATITEVVEYWLERHPDGTAESWKETAARYISSMRENGRRDASLSDKSIKLKILGDGLGNPPTISVDKKAIEDAVDSLAPGRGWSPMTKGKYVNAGVTLVRFYRGEGKRMLKTDETAPITWEAKFIATMMHKAEKIAPAIVPALAVMTFAGLRPTEAMRVGWDAINFDEGLISLTGETTKTRTTRHVTITPNLRRWLVAFKGEGKLVPSPIKYRTEREKLMRALKVKEWPNDVLRHTAATQIYARTKNADETCAELGHFGTEMFLKHYKGVAPKPNDVKKFWAIVPKSKKVSTGEPIANQRKVIVETARGPGSQPETPRP